MPVTTNRSWTLLSVDGPRQHGGNTGYEDSPTSTYCFDSGVANSRNVRAGDLAFIRSGSGLLGVAVIERVDQNVGSKELLRCPICGLSKIRARRSMVPAYRCHDGHEFDIPIQELIDVTKYEAQYGSTFVPVPAGISGIDLRSAAFRPNPQMSIEEIDASRIADRVAANAPGARSILEQFLQRRFVDGSDRTSSDNNSDAEGYGGYVPQMSDRRDRITAAIRERRGQQKFRKDLQKRYGSACAISGSTVTAILEAAHIWPYRGTEDNHPENGLLLRADLHTLYDLNLIGIDEQLQVHITRDLCGTEYEALHGKFLGIALRPSTAAIRARWEAFVREQHFRAA